MKRAWMAGIAAVLCCGAQEQQPRASAGWPCVAGPDPAYVKIAEATGGQVFLFDRSEAARSLVFMQIDHKYPQTIFRAGGKLDGAAEFQFYVDQGVEAALVSVSVQCFESLELIRPTGEALKEESGVEENRYKSGRIIEIPAMQRGTWRMVVSGRGVFSAIIHAKSDIAFGDVEVEEDRVTAEIKGPLQAAKLVRISGMGEALGDLPREDQETADGRRLVGSLAGSRGNFRIMVVGRDQYGNPFQRVYPRLLGKLPN